MTQEEIEKNVYLMDGEFSEETIKLHRKAFMDMLIRLNQDGFLDKIESIGCSHVFYYSINQKSK